MAKVLPITFPDASGELNKQTLDGLRWRFLFQWNNRNEFWSWSLFDADGNAVWRGLRITLGVILNRQIVADVRPPGRFVAVDTSGQRKPPGRDDLFNGRVRIVYVTAAEVAAAEAANAS